MGVLENKGDQIEETKCLLPEDTKFIPIEGGNHSQFYYRDGLQDGDGEASISRDAQQIKMRETTHMLLLEIEQTTLRSMSPDTLSNIPTLTVPDLPIMQC